MIYFLKKSLDFSKYIIRYFFHVLLFMEKLINKTYISNKLGMKFLIFFPCAIMSIIIYYPQRLLINIACIIIYYIKDRRFSDFLGDLNRNFNNAF